MKGPWAFKTIVDSEDDPFERDKRHFLIGGGVDCQLTMGMEEYRSQYHESNVKAPSDTIASIINMAVANTEIPDDVDAEELLLNSSFRESLHMGMNTYEYYMNRAKSLWQEDTRVNSIFPKGFPYLQSKLDAKGKQELSQEEGETINAIVASLMNNHPTKDEFKDDDSQVDTFYQLIIYFTYNGIPCKAMLDIVKVDHKDRTIRPYDVKTMGKATLYFPQSMKESRYDIQAAFYTEAIKQWMQSDPIPNVPELKDYHLGSFRFLVETTIPNAQGSPMLWQVSDPVLKAGRFGGIRYLNGYQLESGESTDKPIILKGFDDLLYDYVWYQQHGYKFHKDYVDCGGIATLQLSDLT